MAKTCLRKRWMGAVILSKGTLYNIAGFVPNTLWSGLLAFTTGVSWAGNTYRGTEFMPTQTSIYNTYVPNINALCGVKNLVYNKTNNVIRVYLGSENQTSFFVELMGADGGMIIESRVINKDQEVVVLDKVEVKTGATNIVHSLYALSNCPPCGRPLSLGWPYILLIYGCWDGNMLIYKYDNPSLDQKERGIDGLVRFAYECFVKSSLSTNYLNKIQSVLEANRGDVSGQTDKR